MHANGVDASTTFTDVSTGGADSPHTLTAQGEAQVDTAQKKFGTGSLLCDGSTDMVTAADSEDWNLGTGAFTIDFWMRYNGSPVSDVMPFTLGQNSASDGIRINPRATSSLASFILAGSTHNVTLDSDYAGDTWYHMALVREADGTCHFFRDGVLQDATFSNTNNITGGTAGIAIGATVLGNFSWPGWIDEVRVSKGIARWTSNFTPPSAEYA
jgi:hypothetical protein